MPILGHIVASIDGSMSDFYLGRVMEVFVGFNWTLDKWTTQCIAMTHIYQKYARLASNFIEPHSVGTNKSTKVESRHLAHGRLTKNPLKTGDSCSANLISIRF